MTDEQPKPRSTAGIIGGAIIAAGVAVAGIAGLTSGDKAAEGAPVARLPAARLARDVCVVSIKPLPPVDSKATAQSPGAAPEVLPPGWVRMGDMPLAAVPCDAVTSALAIPDADRARTEAEGVTVEERAIAKLRPEVPLTEVPCIAGEVQFPDGRREVSRCCKAGCSCWGRCGGVPPVELAGAELWPRVLCDQVPEDPRCGGAP